MNKVYDVVAVTGRYTDREGNEKSRYLNVGSVFVNEKGNYSMKLEALPLSQEWNGWLSLFAPKAKDEKPKPQADDEGFSDSIPF